MKKFVRVQLMAVIAALIFSGCTTFEGEIPIEASLPETVYMSPANQDGLNDSLEINLQIPEIKGLTIESYSFTVSDNRGSVVYTDEQVKSTEGWSWNSKKSLPVPEKLVWDGRNTDGSWASDGEYTYRIRARGMKGQEGSTPELPVIVDNTPPSLVLSAPYLVFSPNGDGRQDILPVYQTDSSREDLWEGKILSSRGNTVRTATWEGLTGNFEWNGLDDAGNPVPDGTYSYNVASTDRAGNSFKSNLSNLVLDTRPSPISLNRGTGIISPNGDGRLDQTEFTTALTRTAGLMEWQISVVDSSGSAVRTWSGQAVPERVVFDGLDNRGRRLPDGDYYGRLIATYDNGDSPEAASEKIIIDTMAPSAVFSMDYLIFSPDGDGRRDSVSVNQSSSTEGVWTGRIINSAGLPVIEKNWDERLTPYTWNGRNAAGAVVRDGVYRYEVTATDGGGNRFSGGISVITVDTRLTPVTLTSSARGLSPDGNGVSDTIRFLPAPAIREGISAWSFLAQDADTGSEWSMTSESGKTVPEVITWDGRNNEGLVTDGTYDVSMVVEYEKGNRTETILETTVVVDTIPPVVSVGLEPLPFSPDADGVNDILTITPAITDASAISAWKLEIRDPMGNPFLLIDRSGTPIPFKWNGRSSTGELVRSAEDYKLTLEAVDIYGNRGVYTGTIPVDILVIKEGDRYRISISSIYFKPNTADYRNIDADLARKNMETLDQLAQILKKYGDYKIQLEGHAVRIFWSDPSKWRGEEQNILMPLSTERAEVIRDALIQRGIRASRMSTEGFGGTRPLVPHSDLDNRWKNRRVEFILLR